MDEAETASYWTNPNLNSERSPSEREEWPEDIIVVDDFLADPVAARQTILKLSFEPPPNPAAGVISYNAAIPGALRDEMRPKIEKVLKRPIAYHPRSKCAMTFASVPLNSVCHVDGGDGMRMFNWTVVVYLNLSEQCSGGTDFFRHRPTGHVRNENGVAFYNRDFRDPTKWELVQRVDMRFNRALFTLAWRFHSPAFTFGTEKENARLTINPKVIA